MVIEGLDTSSYQGPVNWRETRDQGNKSFGIPKATEGTTVRDIDFPASWEQLHALQMPRIAYHFFYDALPVPDQVGNLHDYVRAHGHFTYGDGIAVDVEEVSVTDSQLCITGLLAFIRQCWHDINKPVLIYTNGDTWRRLLNNPDHPVFRACALWQAGSGPSLAPLKPWPKGPSIWQYSSTGHSPGVNGTVDLDRFYGTVKQLRKILHTVPNV